MAKHNLSLGRAKYMKLSLACSVQYIKASLTCRSVLVEERSNSDWVSD